MVWGHFLNRQVGALASSDVQCTITFGSHLFLARCQWSASNKDFIWNPLRRTLHSKDFSGIDVVMEASYSDDGSVVVIGIDAIWRGADGAVCIRPSILGHRLVQYLLPLLCPSFFILSPRRSSSQSLSYLTQLPSSPSHHRAFDPETSVCPLLGHTPSPYITTNDLDQELTSPSFSHNFYSHSAGVIYSALTFAGADVLYVCLLNTRVCFPSGLQRVYCRTSTHRIVKCLISP